MIAKPSMMTRFSGALALDNPDGTLYREHTQTGSLTLAAGRSARPGGWALVTIVANGSAINIPSDWIKYGGDDVSIVAGQINHFQLFWSGEYYYYTNKVTVP